DALVGRPHARTAVAVTDVHALALRQEDWFDVVEENFDMARENMARVSLNLLGLHLDLAPDGGFRPPPPGASASVLGLNLVEKMLLVRSQPVFSSATVQALARVAEGVVERELAPGEELFREGHPALEIAVLASGLVAGRRADVKLAPRFGPGDIVGGCAAVGAPQHFLTVTAEGPAVLLTIGREDLFDIMEDHFDLAKSVM